MFASIKKLVCIATLVVVITGFAASLLQADDLATIAEEWSSLWNRTNGWTGADGIYCVNLDGTISSGIESRPEQRTLFVFSDTILGDIDPATLVRSNIKMTNHSFAVLRGSEPAESAIQFFYPEDGITPQLPIRPQEEGEWYWLSECFVFGDKLHSFLLRITRGNGGGAFGFKHIGVDRATWNVTPDGVDFSSLKVTRDDPLAPKLSMFGETVTIAFGSGVLENTEAAGATNPDGFVYLYGHRDERGKKRGLVVARWRPSEIDDPAAWRYFAGDDRWSDNISDAAVIVEGVATELSVTPLEPDKHSENLRGQYALVYTPGTIGSTIAVRLAPTPIGPFGREIIIFREEETKRLGDKVFAYNAKAHPVISRCGELLISYNINSMDSTMQVFREGGIYYPRFIRLSLDRLAAECAALPLAP